MILQLYDIKLKDDIPTLFKVKDFNILDANFNTPSMVTTIVRDLFTQIHWLMSLLIYLPLIMLCIHWVFLNYQEVLLISAWFQCEVFLFVLYLRVRLQ